MEENDGFKGDDWNFGVIEKETTGPARVGKAATA